MSEECRRLHRQVEEKVHSIYVNHVMNAGREKYETLSIAKNVSCISIDIYKDYPSTIQFYLLEKIVQEVMDDPKFRLLNSEFQNIQHLVFSNKPHLYYSRKNIFTIFREYKQLIVANHPIVQNISYSYMW